MSFSFGSFSVLNKPKSLANREFVTENSLLVESFSNEMDNNYYVFVLESAIPESLMYSLRKDLDKEYFYKNYLIVSYVTTNMYKESNIKSIKDYMRANQSDWKKYLNDYKGKTLKSIMSFGAATYGITNNAKILPNYFYSIGVLQSHLFVGEFCKFKETTIIYPVDSIKELYGADSSNNGFQTTFKTRIFREHLKEMASKEIEKPKTDNYNINVLDSKESANTILKNNMNSDICSWDIETSSLDYTTGEIGCVTLCFNGIDGYYIPWNFLDRRLFSACVNSARVRVGANLKFDTKWIWNKGIFNIYPTDSIDLMSHVLASFRPKSLKFMSYLYSAFGGYEDELEHYKKNASFTNYIRIPTHILSKYATLDAIVTYRMYEALLKEIRDFDKKFPNDKIHGESLEYFYSKVVMPALRTYCDIEYNGVFINKDFIEDGRNFLRNSAKEAMDDFNKIMNISDNSVISSPTKIGKLFEERGYPEVPRNERGVYTSGDEALFIWSKNNMPGIKEIKKYRAIMSCLNTFLGDPLSEKDTGWRQFIREENNCLVMHPDNGVMYTETFRMKGFSPNLLNIPTRGTYAPIVKRCLGTPNNNDYRLLTVDYSSLQMRLAGQDTTLNDSGIDINLFDLYKKNSTLGGDAHSLTACNIFCKSIGYEVYEVYDSKSDKNYIFGETQKVRVIRDGVEKTIIGNQINQFDEIVEIC